MKKIYILLLTLVIVITALLGCTMAGAELSLMGTWEGTIDFGDDFEEEFEYTFNSDDSGEVIIRVMEFGEKVSEAKSKFTIVKGYSYDKIITINYKEKDWEDRSYSYILSGNTLTLIKYLKYDGKNKDLKLEKQ